MESSRCVLVMPKLAMGPISIGLGLSAVDMPFARTGTEFTYVRTLCDVLKQARAGRSLEGVL